MIEDVLAFWFGLQEGAVDVSAEKARLWWGKDKALDRLIEERFGDLHREVAQGGLRAWAKSPRGVLALILVLDQFSRVIYRDQPESFACDGQARKLADGAIYSGQDQELRPIERLFVYMPLEHSEDLADQDRSVQLFAALQEDGGRDSGQVFVQSHLFAVAHRDLIVKFGRFPHRNLILGRRSTAAELAYLEQPGAGF